MIDRCLVFRRRLWNGFAGTRKGAFQRLADRERVSVIFIAVSESTPGPLAVNMATFIGSTQGGILGSFVATLGVVLPSFLIILLIASALKNLMKYAPVNAFLSGVRPCVVAMILATALSMALSTLFGLTDLQAGFAPDLRSIAVFAMLGATHLICKIIRKTAPSPILMILFSAGLGILFW